MEGAPHQSKRDAILTHHVSRFRLFCFSCLFFGAFEVFDHYQAGAIVGALESDFIHQGADDLQAAHTRFTRSLKICQDAQDKRGEAITLWWLGATDAKRGDHELAFKRLSDALRTLQAFEMNAEALDCLEDYARLLETARQGEAAVRIYAATATIRETLSIPRSTRREAEMHSRVEAARADLGDRNFETAWSIGRTWSRNEAIEHALAATALPTVTA